MAQVYLWVVDRLREVEVGIANLNILSGDRISHLASVLEPVTGVLVFFDFAMAPVVLQFLVDGGITFLLLGIQLVHKLLDIGDSVPATVVLAARGDDMLLHVHVERGVRSVV